MAQGGPPPEADNQVDQGVGPGSCSRPQLAFLPAQDSRRPEAPGGRLAAEPFLLFPRPDSGPCVGAPSHCQASAQAVPPVFLPLVERTPQLAHLIFPGCIVTWQPLTLLVSAGPSWPPSDQTWLRGSAVHRRASEWKNFSLWPSHPRTHCAQLVVVCPCPSCSLAQPRGPWGQEVLR